MFGSKLVKELKLKGWVQIGSTLFPPNRAPVVNKKKDSSKKNRSYDTNDYRNIRNKENIKEPFCMLIRQQLNLEVWPEFYFSEKREFRIDFAIPKYKIAIEVDGGVWMRKSGHNTGTGIIRDQEKTSLLSASGWRTIRVMPSQLLTKYTIDLISSCIETS